MSISELENENAVLEKSINDLKMQLGIASAEEANQKARVKKVFSIYDVDASGFIDKKEFQTLAAHLGVYLSEESLMETMKDVDVSGDGLISFEEFENWLNVKGKSLETKREGALLKLKLQSQALMKSVSYFKNQVLLRKDLEKSSQAEKFDVDIGVQNVSLNEENSRFMLKLKFENDEKKAALSRPPEAADSSTCFVLDFAISPDASDEELGELYGAVDTLLAPLMSELPVPLSLYVNVIESDDSCSVRRFRIAAYSSLGLTDLEDLLQLNPFELIDNIDIGVESVVDLLGIKSEEFRPWMFIESNFHVKVFYSFLCLFDF